MMYAKSHTTIEHILATSRALLVAHNYNQISMRQIAAEAGITKGAIYHHFDSKETLYLQMMTGYLADLQETLQQAVVAEGTAAEKLTYLTTLYLEKPIDEQRVVQLIRRDSNQFTGETRETLIRAYQEALPNQIEAIITAGIAADGIVAADAKLLAWQFVANVEVCLSDYARDQFDSPEEMAAYVTDLFFGGVALKN